VLELTDAGSRHADQVTHVASGETCGSKLGRGRAGSGRDLTTKCLGLFSLAGKVVVDCVNPIGFDQQGAYALPVDEGSAAQQASAILTGTTVVAAFHHVSAALLDDPDVSSVDTDVMVLGDDRDATDLVAALADAIPGMRGVYGGRLRNAHQVEALTANLISVNRRYKAHAGIRVTDI